MNFLSQLGRRMRDQMGRRPVEPVQPGPPGCSVKCLVPVTGSTQGERRIPFLDRLEIGRSGEGRKPAPGLLLLENTNVSWSHCVITQTPEGRCYVRDVSRNGTRLGGRRLVPNVEAEMHVGQTLDLGNGLQFVLDGKPTAGIKPALAKRGRTNAAPSFAIATVLVGDIRDYTVLVREAPASELQQSVRRVFEILTASVVERGGTVKEFPGDAIVAFWEGDFRGAQAVSACRAVVELDRVVRRIATDSSIWTLQDYPLRMDWALATGSVVIDSFGEEAPIGLSLVGEPVVLASRLEKLANDRTGPILTCRVTREMVARASREMTSEAFEFNGLGETQVKGFERPDHVFALKVPNW